MPSPNVANRNPTRKTLETKGIELGQKLAKRRSQDFASKIQGWNSNGAGVVQRQDEVVVTVEEPDKRSNRSDNIVEVIVDEADSSGGHEHVDEEGNEENAAPDSTGTSGSGGKAAGKMAVSAHSSREIDLDKKAWVRRKSKPQIELPPEVKRATSPKKRLVSDGHWRRDRPIRIEIATPEKETTPKPITIRRSVANVGLKVPPSVQDFVEDVQSPSRMRPPRHSDSRSRSRERGAPADYEDSGVKIHMKRWRRSGTLSERKDAHTSESSFTAGAVSSIDNPSSATDITTPSRSPTKEDPPRATTAPRERSSRPSPGVDEELRRESRRKARTPTQDIETPKSEPRPAVKPVSRSAAPFTPQVYGNRIEGWLAGQSDPFVDKRTVSMTPEPLKVKPKKSRRLDEGSRNDADHSRREYNEQRQRSHRSPERIETAPTSETTDASLSAIPTLKRRAARRDTQSPVKEKLAVEARDGRQTPRNVSDTIVRRQASQDYHIRSTGRAPSDASDHATIIPDGSVLSRASDGDDPRRQTSGLKRKMTKHSDLISVLSMPREENAGIKSARSIRTRRLHPDQATTGDLMNEVTTDELKYQRELRTLVDGVIPVLLSHVLQRTDATGSSPDGQAVTRPIVEMGVALERLKVAHKRIPLHSPDELLKWADNTARAYTDYLKSWRLDFQDVVVNLAPADEKDSVLRDKTGEHLGGDGERVDVAYLLKRPLVRLKHLAKTFKGIGQIRPSAVAEAMAAKYQDLVEEARQRSNDERARLEDEAATAIDPTRARDPRSLAPLAGVVIDPSRSVRARDYFDLDLVHSSGQQLICRIEAILRDDAPERGNSGDILFCEVTTAGRWLLFPPMPASHVSARAGDKEGGIVVMNRGMLPGGREWREIMSLQSSDEAAVAEWLGMLSSTPEPPRLTRQSSFNTLRGPYLKSGSPRGASRIARAPSPSEIDVPIGERATAAAQQWDGSEVNSVAGDDYRPSLRRAKAKRYRTNPSSPASEDSYEQVHARAHRIAEQERYDDKPDRRGQLYRPKSSYTPSASDWSATSSTVSTPRKDYSVWLPSTDRGSSDEDSASEDASHETHHKARPSMHRRTSSVPSMDMPMISKLRKGKPDSVLHQEPSSAPGKLQKRRPTPAKDEPKKQEVRSPATPTHSKATSLGLRSSMLPSFTPAFMKRNRRSSSPLKHEYDPSTASESLSESDVSDVDDAESITSDSSADNDGAISTIGELRDFRNPGAFNRPVSQPPPPKSVYSVGGDSIGPSDSASQTPYRNVTAPAGQPTETVASIFAWADKGAWDTLHPEECCIIVTPGLIEAFDLAQAAHAPSFGDGAQGSPSQRGVKPLVALELTPLVPLRRGTALDISVRSPPTPNSVLRTSNNIMFRSRTTEECEKLYSLINRARIDNPTYIAMQKARGPIATSNWAEVMDKRNAARTGNSSWLRLGSKKSTTYRSNGSRPTSIAATDSSVGTMNTAFSALRRFSGGNRMFNIAKSTLTSREGTRSTYSDSLSSGAATPIPIDPNMGTPLGVTTVKIRLYIRETASKWRDMGSARLTVMLPPRRDPKAPTNPRVTGTEKRIIISGKSEGEVLLDATLGETCFERVARTGIAVSVWEDGHVSAVGGVNSAKSKVYMVQMKSERDAAYTFGMVGKLRY
ncbi:hypothetical protein LTR08_001978 [Meristemomyces frigidus]|nr:hypothetical protein LTR08_001978 [Meristemomyces frigidus]